MIDSTSSDRRVLSTFLLAAMLPLAACAARSEAPTVAPPAAGSATLVTTADVAFMQNMIGHHEQALTMTAMAPSRGAGSRVMKLVEKIDISQTDEIAMMKSWLVERGEPLPDEHHMHGAHMPGMLTDEQLEQLSAARGLEFDRLFLKFMIQHHRGALVMVDTLFATPGAAQDSDIFRFATDVAADQLDEIDQMQYVLETLARQGSEIR